MQLARFIPQLQAMNLIRFGAPRVASLFPSARQNFHTGTAFQDRAKSRTHEEQEQGDIRGLPSPGEAGQKLDVNTDQTISFDHLGPIVVNTDGTMSRITNWDKMAPIERENTMRILGKRNKSRLEALKKKEVEAEAKAEAHGEIRST